MSQIAQQDNLVITMTVALSAMEAETKTKLIECIQGGTVTDVILVSVEAASKTNYGKVVGYLIDATTPDSPKYTVLVANANSGAVTSVALN